MSRYKKGLSVFLLLFSQLLFPLIASAALVDFPTASEYADEMEKRYHIDPSALQNLGESLNVSDQKTTAPEVMLFFSPNNPTPGKDITAQANPLYFTNSKELLYYTWYLKHKDCEEGSVTSKNKFCDADNDGNIDENDWKIEAMRTLANGGFDTSRIDYDTVSDSDNDGYTVNYGGDEAKGRSYCYAQDFTSGTLYELALPDPIPAEHTSGDSAYSAPVSANSECKHYFPDSQTGDKVGDGSFGRSEEKFWQTDPTDPDTAGTGRGDEANVVGLGQSSLTWTYSVGDQVGVLVEGTSVIPTKHDDRSYAIMWALPKNQCPVTPTSPASYAVKGGGTADPSDDVLIPTATIDFDKCLKNNLVDPREGGQTEKLKVSLGYSPETLSNDASGDDFGNTVTVSSSVDNTVTAENLLGYEWNISLSKNGSFDPRGYSPDPNRDTTGGSGGWIDITNFLETNKLVSFTKGNGLNELQITLNITDKLLKAYDAPGIKDARKGDIAKLKTKDIFSGGTGYLKVSTRVTEYIDTDGKSRSDTASIIVPVISTDRRILAKSVDIANGKLSLKDTLCEEKVTESNPLGIGRNLCLVAKNEIIGLTPNNTEGLSDFQWTVNGQPLSCTTQMSSQCSDSSATNVSFLPVTGDSGQTYSVALTAIDTESGKKITLSRAFQITDPYIQISSGNKDIAWPKYLGYYKGTDGYAYENVSDTQFQGFPSTEPAFQVRFFPSWIENRSQWKWTVDGTEIPNENLKNITIPLTGTIGTVHTITVQGYSTENSAVRSALSSLWDYSVFDSTEHRLTKTVQIQIVPNESETDALASPTSFFAAVAKNAPKQILFLAQLFLSLFTIIVLMGVVFSLGKQRR